MSAEDKKFVLYEADLTSKNEISRHRAITGPLSEKEALVIVERGSKAVVAVVDRDEAIEWDRGCERCAQVRTN